VAVDEIGIVAKKKSILALTAGIVKIPGFLQLWKKMRTTEHDSGSTW
jgi:hypothetical protein